MRRLKRVKEDTLATKKKTTKKTPNDNHDNNASDLPVQAPPKKDETPAASAVPQTRQHRVRNEEFSRELTCKLDDREVLDRASRAAKVLQRKLDLEGEFDEEKKRWKGLISKSDLEHRMLSQEVRTRETLREVQCERVFDFTAGEVYEHRLDTFERIDTRPMTKAERQGRLSIV